MKKPKHRAGFVAILGRPNAGKSTLLNALVGQKVAIVAPRPQTTRTSIQGVLTIPGAQIVFVDTPGIHKTVSLLNKRMMDMVRSSTDADVLLFLVDATARPSEEDAQAVDLMKKSPAPVIAVFNKVDRLRDKPALLALIDRYRAMHEFAAYVPISALKGEGLDVLRAEIVARLPEGASLYPSSHLTNQPERFLAAELLREKILLATRQEVPHAVAVLVEDWKDEPKLVRIAATIYVDRPGQKAILIGAGGALLKKVGTQARQEIEAMIGKKVFLQTFVKVRPNWREDPEFLAASDWRTMVGASDVQ
ncbi:MAG TPA: GTPase Era [Bryobacteraceae bacterium]|nr:GTPase Era [Bryobacteraceae bacterium]